MDPNVLFHRTRSRSIKIWNCCHCEIVDEGSSNIKIKWRNIKILSILHFGYDDVIKFSQNLLEIGIRNKKTNLSKQRKKDQKHNSKSAIRWKLYAIARLGRKRIRRRSVELCRTGTSLLW